MANENLIIGASIIILNLIGMFFKKGKYLVLTAIISLIMALLLVFGVI